MNRFDASGFELTAPASAELRISVNGKETTAVPNRNGVFSARIPQDARTLELLIRSDLRQPLELLL